ncbi:MAG: hypothetical protein HY721_08010 [Planctomycetes bacterium]|nr:hypothetical protein [Planctomycetota bacterium]
MPPRQYEIYLARIQFKDCDDIRPCILAEDPQGQEVKVFPLSSNLDLYDPKAHFLIEESSVGFASSGLKRTSFASDRVYIVRTDQLGRRRLGKLEGELLDDFVRWSWV